MGNVIVSLKNAIKSVTNMITQFVSEFTKSNNNATATPPSSLFSYLFKIPSQSPPCNFSTQNFRSRFQQVEGLHCIINETQKPLTLYDSKNNDISNASVYDSTTLLFIRKRKVTNILPIVLTNKFLLYCFGCNKNLSGKDIYVYRGEWSFCSVDCRIEGIKAKLDNPNKVNSQHLLSSQTSSDCADSVVFYVGDH